MLAPSPRRPRSPLLPPVTKTALPTHALPAYALPPPLAVSVFALVSVSLTVAVRTLFTPPRPSPSSSSNPLRLLTLRLRAHLRSLRPPPPPTAISTTTPPTSPVNVANKLDELRDRAVAQLDNQRLASASVLTDEEYQTLSSLQRRELLASAFMAATLQPAPAAAAPAPPLHEKEKVTTGSAPPKKGHSGFLKALESANGRAAAIGFVLCLAREMAEPGHPSMFEQVMDVVVPVVQNTPPFLVAVCDRVVDLLT